MANDLITELTALDDAALTKKLGLSDKLDKFKSDLARAAKLEGKPRDKVLAGLKEMFTPNVYPDELGWKVDSAERAAKRDADGPAELVGCCCDVPQAVSPDYD